jgi:hypothetical protein
MAWMTSAKQIAIRNALQDNPRGADEMKTAYRKRIASLVGVSVGYVQWVDSMDEAAENGRKRREQEAEEAKTRCNVMGAEFSGLSVQSFRGWADVFGKIKIVTEVYMTLARTRGDVFAKSFLSDIRDTCERA